MVASFFEAVVAAIYRVINRRRVWYRLPFPIAVINLLALRVDLRRLNLFDTETAPLDPPVPIGFDVRHCRTADGTFNDLSKTWMGMANARFGRNAPLAQTFGEQPPGLYEPNPRVVSRDLLARSNFIPATTVNLFLAAWLQFMVHDWLSHGVNDRQSPPLRFPVPEGDDWPKPEITFCAPVRITSAGRRTRVGRQPIATSSPIGGMDLKCTAPIPAALCAQRPANALARRQAVFGRDRTSAARPGGRRRGPGPRIRRRQRQLVDRTFVMHTLFAREHNAIVDRLHIEYPDKDGEWLFQKARLINAARSLRSMPPNGRRRCCRRRRCNTLCGAAGGARSGKPISRRSAGRRTTKSFPAFPDHRNIMPRPIPSPRSLRRSIGCTR